MHEYLKQISIILKLKNKRRLSFNLEPSFKVYGKYTMHNKLSIFLCFASLCAHLCALSNNFKCDDENRILGK